MIDRVEHWFEGRGWSPFEFQRRTWDALRAGESGLVHAPTGLGKTYSVWFGSLLEAADAGALKPGKVRVVWITPLRALSRDTADALAEPLEQLGVPWRVELRTGDTPSSRKAKQRSKPPEVLVTTPESLTILLSYKDGARMFAGLRTIVVDEWHELLSTKRGVQTELALARLRSIAPGVRTWGLSATLGNLDEAASALVGRSPDPPTIIRGVAPKRIDVETIMPEDATRYPWAGHIGIALLDKVVEQITRARTTLVFTNTRSQAEIWFGAILRRHPVMLGTVALHHGSLARPIREEIERMLDTGSENSALRAVICTSSLDLGVDFHPVDQVIQISSPKGVARLVQRAGRSGHRPGVPSRIFGVPSHALELVEYAATRDAIARGLIEARPPIRKPMDVLVQHLVTLAAGGGVDDAAARAQVESTHAYHGLTETEWAWALAFVRGGGPSLRAYPDYSRVADDDHGSWTIPDRRVERRHRMGIGTIVADASVNVRFGNGKHLGSIEESFISRIVPGDRFVFAGRVLELVRLREMTATVRTARSKRGIVPRWNGGKMPLSSHLADAVRRKLDEAARGIYDDPEMRAVQRLLERQRVSSRIPRLGETLVELIETRDGRHAFLYTFAGRAAHEGIGAVLAHRLTRRAPSTVRATVNDYGIELFSEDALEADDRILDAVFAPGDLADDLVAALHGAELARRQFREIARIAGLTFQGFPGHSKPAKHLQASSNMFYDVFRDFDPENLLLSQAQREVLEGQLEFTRLDGAMRDVREQGFVIVRPDRLTPLAFPLWAETMRATYTSTESWETRVKKMAATLEETDERENTRRA